MRCMFFIMGCYRRRYVYENRLLQAVRASPGVKAATLSRESQALTHAVRAQLDSQCMQGDAEVGNEYTISTVIICDPICLRCSWYFVFMYRYLETSVYIQRQHQH